jgi:hypothetical protein
MYEYFAFSANIEDSALWSSWKVILFLCLNKTSWRWVGSWRQSSMVTDLDVRWRWAVSYCCEYKEDSAPESLSITNFTEQKSPSWEANSYSASQEIAHLLWNPKVHHRVHKSPPLVPVLIQMRTVQTQSVSFRSILILGTGIAQWYLAGLRAGWSLLRIPAGSRNFSLHHSVQTGSGAHPASYPMGTRYSFPGGEVAGAWSWPLTSTSCRGHECVELYL